jgi:hypothetical protein
VSANAVLIRQADGSTVAFPIAELHKALFLARVQRMGGLPEPGGPVADALENATSEERARVEKLGDGGAFFETLDDPDFEPETEIGDYSE